jgi:predicted RNase H-like HicB family nuclease
MKLKVLLYQSEDAVCAPALPGCWSQGSTREEALENIADAAREYLDTDVGQTDGAEVQEVEVAV